MIGIRISIVFLLMCLLSFAKCAKCDCKLLSVVTIYRHGARTPFKIYKNDPYLKLNNEIWPQGFTQLTNVGKNQLYQLGKWFRKYYKDFIPVKYDHKFIKVMSSDRDRCLMSASCNLAALFPPKDSQIWNKELLWQPVPIHTVPVDNDVLFTMRKQCSKYDKLMIDLIQNHKDYKKYMEDAQPIIKYIEKHSGEKCDLEDLKFIHDTLFIEQSYGLVLPKWTDKVFPNLTLPFLTFSFVRATYTPKLARFRSGPLIDYITTFFEQVLEKPNNSQKFLMLSGHDSTITNFLTSVGLYDNSWPEYASSLNIELKSRDNQSFLNIFFRNSSGIHQLTLNDCIYDCDFDKFKKLTQHLRISPAQWDKECANV